MCLNSLVMIFTSERQAHGFLISLNWGEKKTKTNNKNHYNPGWGAH